MIKLISGTASEINNKLEELEKTYSVTIIKQNIVHRPNKVISELIYLSLDLTKESY